MKASFFLTAILTGLLATPALAQNSGDHWKSNHGQRKTCLQVGRIYSWRAPDNRTLIVENDTHQKFKLHLMGHCPGLTFKETIGFRSPGGSYLSCVSPGDTVFFHDTGMSMHCVIKKVTAYTPEMEKVDKAAKKKD
jgi:hypothetical protein